MKKKLFTPIGFIMIFSLLLTLFSCGGSNPTEQQPLKQPKQLETPKKGIPTIIPSINMIMLMTRKKSPTIVKGINTSFSMIRPSLVG